MVNKPRHMINGVEHNDLTLKLIKLIALEQPSKDSMAKRLGIPWNTLHKNLVRFAKKLGVDHSNHYHFYSNLIKHYNDNKDEIEATIQRLELKVPTLDKYGICQTKLISPNQ